MNLAWIPNLLTFGNLTCGFISVVLASRGAAEALTAAGLLIFLAALLDGMDGQVARWLKVSRPIGKELDSLADCVAFGVAPGYLAYRMYLIGTHLPLGSRSLDLGILIAAVFPICAAYRLARFNIQSSPGSFSGLPSPIAGILVALVPLIFRTVHIPRPVFAFAFLLVAFLMVSTVTYGKPQATVLKRLHGLRLIGLVILVGLLLVLFRFWLVFLFVALYVLSGLVSWVIQFLEERRY